MTFYNADEIQEQQIEMLIELLQNQNEDVRKDASLTLSSIGEGEINVATALINSNRYA